MHTGKIILLCIACIPLLFSASRGAIQTYEDKIIFLNETGLLGVIENYPITGVQSSFTFTRDNDA